MSRFMKGLISLLCLFVNGIGTHNTSIEDMCPEDLQYLLQQRQKCREDGVFGDNALQTFISTKGVKGAVYIEPNFMPGVALMVVKFPRLEHSHVWEIRENRAPTSVRESCRDKNLGKRFIQKTALLTPGLEHQFFGLKLDASQLNGRSLLLTNTVTGERACGTLEASIPHNTAEARFLSNVAGTITFRQPEDGPSSDTSILVNLFKTREEVPVPEQLNWFIIDNPMQDKYKTSFDPECSISGYYRHETSRFRELILRQGSIPVGAKKDDATTTFIDLNLPLKGPNSIVGRTMVLSRDNGEIVACAFIRNIEPKEAIASIFNDGVKGSVIFEQRSPYDTAYVTLDLENLRGIAGGYHVHKWPVPVKLESSDNVCDDVSVSGHYNPFNIDIKASPPPGTGSDNEYEVGDLSGKFGLLNGLNSIKRKFRDRNLSLYGKYSIVGRSFVIHRQVDGSRWVCASIKPTIPVVKAFATLLGPVIGSVVFTQATDDYYSDTSVFVELSYANGIQLPTRNHNWHVHVNRICEPFNTSSSCECMAAGPHFNPFDVNVNGNYKTECEFCNPLRCEAGDLSGKLETVDVRSDNRIFYRGYFTGENIPLKGPFGIIGRSIVVHETEKGAGRIACANIDELPARSLIVNQWSQMKPSNAEGSLEFVGNIPNYQDEITWTFMRLRGLEGLGVGYHVHTEPVHPTFSQPCANSIVGGHFNPFNVDIKGSPPAGTGTHDMYEVGDLSGKYGNVLEGKNYVFATGPDNFLPVRGPLSITGRSLVIHQKDGSRWICGNIVEHVRRSGARAVEAVANFDRGLLRGTINLKQYIYRDGTMSDTEILVHLDFATDPNSKSQNHNWHVHDNPVDGEGNCLDAGPHFNPYNVNVKEGYDECSFSNPLRCELGDTTGKQQPYEIGGGFKFYTDVNLPLLGRFGVIGRSFVIHVANRGAARLACANIVLVT